MGSPAYASVEQIMAAADYKAAAHQTARIRRLALSASRRIERRLRRHFYPLVETRSYQNPRYAAPRGVESTGFWLEDDLLELTSVTQDGTALTVADVELWPTPEGPPYSWIGVTGSEIDVEAVWGFSDDTEPAGALAEALDASETAVDVTDSAKVGVGDLIKVDDERMIVEAKSMLDTAQDLQADLTAQASDDTVTVEDGTGYAEGEEILLGSERMLIVDISGNDLQVERAYSGTTLAAHTGAVDVYAPRRLTVERGAAGTTAATHSDTTAITRNVPPEAITDLAIAEAIHTFEQETSGYGRTVGSGENQRGARGVGLAGARQEADRYRRLRLAAI